MVTTNAREDEIEPSHAVLPGLEVLPALDRAALFLDFDGTLVELAPRPDAVEVPPGTEDLLSALRRATGGAVAIVSGRSLADLERLLPNYDGVAIGSHGAERRLDGRRMPIEIGDLTVLDAARAELTTWADERPGIVFEEKVASLVLHFRGAPEREKECREALETVAGRLPDFAVRPAKMAFELMPANVSKRTALADLLDTWPDRIPVAIGDDRTDEAMFDICAERGGFGIKVGEGESAAPHRIADVTGIHDLLRRWLDRSERA